MQSLRRVGSCGQAERAWRLRRRADSLPSITTQIQRLWQLISVADWMKKILSEGTMDSV